MQAIADNMLFSLPDFMASSNGRKSDSQRPRPLHLSKSFTRIEPPSPDRLTRSQRASTIQNGVIPDDMTTSLSRENKDPRGLPDAFGAHAEDDDEYTGTPISPPSKPEDFDELPIELASLSDRFASCGIWIQISSDCCIVS